MCLTGAFLILFVTFHVLMNGVAIFWPTAYNMVCEFLGANWYALIGSGVLALGFILHIVYATWLTVQNRKARGHERYEVTSRPPQVEWSSKNMLVLGIVILAFLVLHLVQFWSKMQWAEITGHEVVDPANGAVVPPAAGTWFLQMAFSNGIFLAAYLIGFIALWFHMTHGFWSMFQSCGWNGRTWMLRLKCIGNWWATIVCLLFAAEAIVFTVQAHRNVYTECPALQQQYIEMYMSHDGEGAFVSPEAGMVCENAGCTNTGCVKENCTPADCGKEQCGQQPCGQNAACDACPQAEVVETTTIVTE